MRPVPRFWTTVDGQARYADGRPLALRVWGWSTSSLADAAAVAGERLAQARANAAAGQELESWKYYPRLPLREETLVEVTNGETLLAVVTRNRYGAEVLNTDLFLIADVDLPEESSPTDRRGTSSASGGGTSSASGGGWLSRVFGRWSGPSAGSAVEPGTAPGDAAPASIAETEALGRIAAFAEANPSLGVRTYRTAAGLRVLVTGGDLPPGTPAAETVLQQLESDPVYVLLCATHQTYRARLTPKPWRCGHRALSIQWPHPEADGAERQRWTSRYAERSARYATTRLLSVTGPAPSAEESQIIELHDGVSKAREECLALA